MVSRQRLWKVQNFAIRRETAIDHFHNRRTKNDQRSVPNKSEGDFLIGRSLILDHTTLVIEWTLSKGHIDIPNLEIEVRADSE